MMFVVKNKGVIIITCFILLLYISFLCVIENRRNDNNSSIKDYGLWDLPPVLLSAVAGEFKGILASYMIVDAGSRVGTRVERGPDGSNIAAPHSYNCGTLHRMIKASQSLDPAFGQTYNISQGWLPWPPCNMVVENMEILQTARENRPWDLFPTLHLAFNNYYFLNDYQKAGEILLREAANRPNAPFYLAILGSRLSKKGGDTAAALAFLQSIVANKAPEEPGYQDLHNRISALEGVLIVEDAVKKYHKKFASYPELQNQLVEKGILSVIPKIPYNMEYCINQQGQVFFDRPDCRK